jgi:hypothetical protein
MLSEAEAGIKGRVMKEVRYWLCVALAGLLDAPMISLVYRGPGSLPVRLVFLLHAFVPLALLFALPREAGWFNRKRHWLEPFLVFSLVFPGVGWIMAAVLRFFSTAEPAGEERLQEEETESGELFPEQRPGTSTGDLRSLHEAADVLPAVDILMGTDDSLKRGAIQTLAKIRTPGSIEWILKARSDENPDVRFYATNTLTQLKYEFEREMKAVEREIFNQPGELRFQNDLCRAMYEYAVSGLVDPARAKDILWQCRKRLTDIVPYHRESLRLLFKVEKEGDPKAALGRVRDLEENFPWEETDWLKEKTLLFFRLGRYAEVQGAMRDLESRLGPGGGKSGESAVIEREWRAAAFWWRAES